MDPFTEKNPTWLNSNWLLVGLLVLTALLVWGTLRQGQSWGDDYASYIMQAQSILTGSIPKFMAENQFTIEHSTITLGPVAYPWGTPLLLSPILYFKGLDIQALKGLNIICFFCFLVLLWVGIRKYLSPVWGLFFFALFAFNPSLINSLNDILSDIPFLLFSTLCVILIHRVFIEKVPLVSRMADMLIVGLAIAVATTIRLNGILLLVVLFTTQAVQNYQQRSTNERGRRIVRDLTAVFPKNIQNLLLQSLPYLVFILFFAVWMAIFPGTFGYSFGEFGRLKLSTFFYHIYYYFYIPIEFIYPLNQSWLLFELFAIFTVWGILRRIVKDFDFIIYILISILFWLIWPSLQGLRLIFPILPLILYFIIWGIQCYASEIQEKIRGPFCWGIFILLTGIVFIFVTFIISDAVQNLQQGRILIDGPYSIESQQALAYISNNTNENDVIVFYKPRALRLFTHRLSVAIPYPKALELGDYLLLDVNLPRELSLVSLEQATLLEEQGKLNLVFQNGIYSLYRVYH